MFFASSYIFAVVLSLQQEDFAVFASFVQQDFPLAHFFLFFPLSAKATPVTNIKAVANKNTFFMIMSFNFCKRENRAEIANCQFLNR